MRNGVNVVEYQIPAEQTPSRW